MKRAIPPHPSRKGFPCPTKMIGDSELLIIIIVTFFLFGPDKLPKIAKKIGKASGEFKKAYKEAEGELGEEIDELKRLKDDFTN